LGSCPTGGFARKAQLHGVSYFEIQRCKNRMVEFKINLAESSKESYGSKRALLPMIMMMI
jgi:hypothetical protein